MSGVDHIEITAADADRRLDRWLRERFPQLTQGLIEKLLRKGDIRVDGGKVKSGHRLEEYMTVRIPPLPKDSAPAKPRGPEVPAADAKFIRDIVMYEDENLIVINKPAGIPVQGGTGQNRHIDGMLPALADGGETPKLVHRIDKDTSGLLMLARTGLAARNLTAAFRSKAARKTYWAAVIGVPKPRDGTIKAGLMKAPGSHGEKMTCIDPNEVDEHFGAKRAITDYAVVDTASTRTSWLVVRPVTGRTHQIRAHLSLIGHPIIGDGKYGPRSEEAEKRVEGAVSRKLHLHSRRLQVPDPDGSGRILDFRAPLSEHMAHSWRLFGWDVNMQDDDDLLPEMFEQTQGKKR